MIFPYSSPAGAMLMLFPFELHWVGTSQWMQLQGLEIQIQTVPSSHPWLLNNRTLVGTEILPPDLEGWAATTLPGCLQGSVCVVICLVWSL